MRQSGTRSGEIHSFPTLACHSTATTSKTAPCSAAVLQGRSRSSAARSASTPASASCLASASASSMSSRVASTSSSRRVFSSTMRFMCETCSRSASSSSRRAKSPSSGPAARAAKTFFGRADDARAREASSPPLPEATISSEASFFSASRAWRSSFSLSRRRWSSLHKSSVAASRSLPSSTRRDSMRAESRWRSAASSSPSVAVHSLVSAAPAAKRRPKRDRGCCVTPSRGVVGSAGCTGVRSVSKKSPTFQRAGLSHVVSFVALLW
mmetsp:Transcript_9253/g.30594  ORF Transcript_9253/g.30594 Transcript_9253/m.30594 type:complete len:267 (-) Transcript_9253:126-926(-)